MNHTPGPWFADKDGGIWRRNPRELYQNGGGVAGDQPLARATVGHFRWENKFPLEANARLMAASPDLLLAAVSLLEWVGELQETGKSPTHDAIWPMRAAIARATGADQ